MSPILDPTKYTERHDNVGKLLYINLAEYFELLHDKGQYLKTSMQKCYGILAYKLTSILHIINLTYLSMTRKKTIYLLLILPLPSDYNVVAKRAEKLRNYTDLAIELKSIWNVSKVVIVPFIIGATGVIHNQFDRDIRNLPIKIRIEEYQKIALLGTANITRSFFQGKR